MALALLGKSPLRASLPGSKAGPAEDDLGAQLQVESQAEI